MNTDREPRLSTTVAARALIIVRDAVMSSLVRYSLSRAGVGFVMECCASTMVATIERTPGFDLVVIDEASDGIAALHALSYLRRRLPDTPILFLASSDAGLVEAAARANGAARCLTKPLEPAATLAAIRAILEHGVTRDVAGAVPASLVRSGSPRTTRGGDHLWATVLAGGDDGQLRPLVHHVHRESRPKQYATLIGKRTMLARTLDRTSLLIPGERTVVVTVRQHRRFFRDALGGRSAVVLTQPSDRGTAAGIALSLEFIIQRDPEATVAIFPSDHFVDADQDFMTHIADVATFVDIEPARIALVGVEATEAETEYGLIETGPLLARVRETTISDVSRLVERPSGQIAHASLVTGALWNTLVVVARVSTLRDAVRQLLPGMHRRLAAVAPLLGSRDGITALRQTYADLTPAKFASAVLEQCTPLLVVSKLRHVTWCDWGSPARVVRSLERIGWRPAWLETFMTGRLA